MTTTKIIAIVNPVGPKKLPTNNKTAVSMPNKRTVFIWFITAILEVKTLEILIYLKAFRLI